MQNRKNKIFKTYISVFFTAMYLFVTLFSANLHNHNGESFYKDSGFKKSEKTITTDITKSQAGDCLACHFLATGHAPLPEAFSYQLVAHTQLAEETFALQEKIWSETKFSIQLRGPPAIS